MLLSKQTRKAVTPLIYTRLNPFLCTKMCLDMFACAVYVLKCVCTPQFICLSSFSSQRQDLCTHIFLLPLRIGMCWFAGFENNKATRGLRAHFAWGHGSPTQHVLTWEGILFWILPRWCHTFALFFTLLVCFVSIVDYNCRLSKLQAVATAGRMAVIISFG